MVIDIRVRPPYKSWLQTYIYTHKERTSGTARQVGMEPPRSFVEESMPELLREMAEAGITRAVIPGHKALRPQSASAPGQAPTGPTFEMVPNGEIHEVVQQHPDIFAGVAAIDPLATDALEEIERTVGQWGFRGVAIDPGLAAEPMHPDDERLFPIYEACQRHDVPVLIKISHQMGPHIGYGDPLHLGLAAAAFPKLPMVIVHGAWPYTREAIAVAHRHKNVYVQPDFYMLFPGNSDYVQAANMFLMDRLLYCSGYPMAPVGDFLARFKELPFAPSVLPKVLYENAKRLFKL